jgi:hypothetical protein
MASHSAASTRAAAASREGERIGSAGQGVGECVPRPAARTGRNAPGLVRERMVRPALHRLSERRKGGKGAKWCAARHCRVRSDSGGRFESVKARTWRNLGDEDEPLDHELTVTHGRCRRGAPQGGAPEQDGDGP